MPTPYDDWPADEFGRWNEAQRAFGEHVLQSLAYLLQANTQRYAALCPSASSEQIQAMAQKAAWDGIYAVMMLLDGVASCPVDSTHSIEYTLNARILHFEDKTRTVDVPLDSGKAVTLSSFRPSGTERIDEVELAPAGDGLCGAFHCWNGDIDQ